MQLCTFFFLSLKVEHRLGWHASTMGPESLTSAVQTFRETLFSSPLFHKGEVYGSKRLWVFGALKLCCATQCPNCYCGCTVVLQARIAPCEGLYDSTAHLSDIILCECYSLGTGAYGRFPLFLLRFRNPIHCFVIVLSHVPDGL
jgi:hypothetical protein